MSAETVGKDEKQTAKEETVDQRTVSFTVHEVLTMQTLILSYASLIMEQASGQQDDIKNKLIREMAHGIFRDSVEWLRRVKPDDFDRDENKLEARKIQTLMEEFDPLSFDDCL